MRNDIFFDLSKGTLQNALLLNVIPTALIGLLQLACKLMLANLKLNEKNEIECLRKHHFLHVTPLAYSKVGDTSSFYPFYIVCFSSGLV